MPVMCIPRPLLPLLHVFSATSSPGWVRVTRTCGRAVSCFLPSFSLTSFLPNIYYLYTISYLVRLPRRVPCTARAVTWGVGAKPSSLEGDTLCHHFPVPALGGKGGVWLEVLSFQTPLPLPGGSAQGLAEIRRCREASG